MKIENNVHFSIMRPEDFEDVQQCNDISELSTKRLTDVYEEATSTFKFFCGSFIAIPIILAIIFGGMFIPILNVIFLVLFIVGILLSPFIAVGTFACVCESFVDMMDCKTELESRTRKESKNESDITKHKNS